MSDPIRPQAPTNPGHDVPAGTPGSGENVCPACGGSGVVGATPCANCGGSGKVEVGIGGG